MSIEYTEMLIDEEQAISMLNTSKGNPRYNKQNKVNSLTVERYANDMRNGKWQFSPEPISFNEDGELVDGHHRLNAIVKSGVPIRMIVAKNVPNETKIFDRGLRRTTSQLIKYSEGMDKSLGSSQALAAVKVYLAHSRSNNSPRVSERMKEAAKVTDSEIVDFINENSDELSFAVKVTKSNGNGVNRSLMENAACIFAFLCAVKSGVPRETIQDFARVVRTGLYDCKEQTAAIMARNYLLSNPQHDFQTTIHKTEYVQTCLMDFVRNVPRERKYVRASAYFTNKIFSQQASM